MGMPKNLYLVRHGQSEGNVINHKYEESGDESLFSQHFLNIHESQYHLTELGINQAKMAGEWFKEKGIVYFDRAIVSNNTRAIETASYLGLPHVDWMIDFNLRERESGLFNVIPPKRRSLEYRDQQMFYDTQPFLFRPPQGESLADVAQRIKIILDTMARECDGDDVVIVCHGHVIRVFRMVLERMTLQESNAYLSTKEDWGKVPNCSITHYTRENLDNPLTPTKSFNRTRIICPAGGGEREGKFREIVRKKYSNAELLELVREK